MKIPGLLGKFFKWLKPKVLTFFVLLGVLIVGGGIATGIVIESRLFAVLAVSFGTMVGTLLFSTLFPYLVTVEAERAQEAVEEKFNKLRKYKDRFREHEAEICRLERELERHRSMRINVDSYQSMLKLGVLDCDMEITDFVEKPLAGDKESGEITVKGGLVHRNKVESYVGVLHKKFKTTYGVDLQKLSFKAQDQNTVLVYGLKGESQGRKDENNDWKLAQIQIHKTPAKNLASKVEEITVETARSELLHLRDEQIAQLNNRIDQGIQSKNFIHFVEEPVKRFLKLIFAPQNKQLVFVSSEIAEDALPLLQFLNQHNQLIESKIHEIEVERSGLQMPSDNHGLEEE